MELRHLRYFVKSAETLHFTRAAEMLHISQPNLSLQIQQLELELGTTLFQRIGRNVHLTEAGKLLLEHAKRALNEVEGAQQEIGDLRGLIRGTLRIGTTYCFNAEVFPTMLSTFVDVYPTAHIEVTETTTRGVEQGLLSADFDVGLVFHNSKNSAFHAKELFTEDIVVLASPRHSLAGLKTIHIWDLKDVRLALPSAEYSTRQAVNACFARVGIEPKILLETNDINGLLAVVRSGKAAAVLSRQSAAHLADLCTIPLEEDGCILTANLIWPNETQLSSLGKRFVEVATKVMSPSTPLPHIDIPHPQVGENISRQL